MATYEAIRETVKGFNIHNICLSQDNIYIMAENYFNPEIHNPDKYDELYYPKEMSILLFLPNISEVGNEWSGVNYHCNGVRKAVSVASKNIAFLGVLPNGLNIRQFNSDIKERAESLQLEKGFNGSRLEGGVTDLCVIDDEIYACCTGGQIFKKIGDDKWKQITNQKVKKSFQDDNFMKGFHCITGFSKDEIYAGGMHGILWLKDRKEWKKIDVPTQNNIKQLICSPNGEVYINCSEYILKGRKDKWEKIISNETLTENGIDKISWFQNKLYLLAGTASVDGLFVYDNQRIEKVKVGHMSINLDSMIGNDLQTAIDIENSEIGVTIPAGINSMVANDKLLAITGDDNVILFDGNRWFNLFDKNRTEKELRESGTFYAQ